MNNPFCKNFQNIDRNKTVKFGVCKGIVITIYKCKQIKFKKNKHLIVCLFVCLFIYFLFFNAQMNCLQ